MHVNVSVCAGLVRVHHDCLETEEGQQGEGTWPRDSESESRYIRRTYFREDQPRLGHFHIQT